MSDDLEEIRSRDPLKLTKNGPEIRALIAFYRSKRRNFMHPAPKEPKVRAKAMAGPVPKLSLDALIGGPGGSTTS